MRRTRLAVLGALLTVLAATAPALADPTPSPTAQAPESPLKIGVDTLLPRAPMRHDAFLLRGSVTNTDTQATVTNARVRLAVGDVITARGDLHNADTDRPPTVPNNSVFATVQPSVLPPGATGSFVLRTNVDDLGLRSTGVYPLDIEARGTLPGENQQTLGLSPTWVPFFQDQPLANKVALAVPLVDKPRQAPNGTFLDDALATSLARRGRLDNLLRGAYDGASTPSACGVREHGLAPGSTALQAIPKLTRCEAVPVTYAVDPDLLSAADLMAKADKYEIGQGKSATAGTGKAAAGAWLSLLKQGVAADTGSVVVLPYGDPDVSALAASAPGQQDITDAVQFGDRIAGTLLSRSSLPIAWPPDTGVAGVLTHDAAQTLAASRGQTFILDQSAYAEPDPGSFTPSARTKLDYRSGAEAPLYGLVADPDLSDLITGTKTDCSCAVSEVGPRLSEQRFIAETAILAAERPGRSRTFLIAPSRDADASVSATSQAVSDLGRLPWLCPVTVASLIGTGSEHCAGSFTGRTGTAAEVDTTRGDLRTSEDGLLAHNYLQAVGKVRDDLDQFIDYVVDSRVTGKLESERDALATRLKQAVFRAESAAWRDDPLGAESGKNRLRDAVDGPAHGLTQQVSVTGGKLLLTSSKGTLQVSVQNQLDLPITVRVHFTIPSILTPFISAPVSVGPNSAVSASVKVDAQRSGKFVVAVRMYDHNELKPRPFGTGTNLAVRSTQYGRFALGLTFAAAAVLFIAAGVRIVRRSLRAPPPAAEPPAAG